MLKRLVAAGISGLLTIGMLGLPSIAATAGDTDSTSVVTTDEKVKKDPYTVVQVTDHQDGSGFGTSDAPYVTKEHGYSVGDEGPQDGVVTSGDIAWYKAHVTFLAAKHRTVTVKFDDLGDALTATKPACPSGHFVSVETLSNACWYTIPSGVSESVDLTLNLTAKDTGGKTVSADPKIVVERSDGGSSGMKLGRLTVTSVPMMDVYLDKNDRQIGETYASFSIQTRALHPAGVSTVKGFSRFAPYSALLDLTGLPDGVSVIVDGKNYTPTNGLVQLPEVSGDRSVTVLSLPQPNPSEQRKYDVHITVSSSMFDWKDQPGDGLGRDDSTLDTNTGARSGVSYPNNDWLMISTIGVNKYKADDSGGIGDMLHFDRPYTSGQTKWDDGNLRQADADTTWFDPMYNTGDNHSGDWIPRYTYGHNMEFTAKAHLDFGGVYGAVCPDENPCVTHYQWGEGLTMTSLPVTTDENGRVLPDGTYKILYGTTNIDENHWIAGWAVPDEYGFKDGLTDTPPSDLSTIRRIVILRLTSQPKGWLSWGMKATGLGTTEVSGIGVNAGSRPWLLHEALVSVIDPRPSRADVVGGYTVDRSHRMVNTSKKDDIEAGDRVTGTWQISLSNVPTATQPITTSVDVCLPKGLVAQATLKADGWTAEETSSEKCATGWHLTYSGKAENPLPYAGGKTLDMVNYNLPSISWSGTVQPTAQGTLTPSLTGTVHMDAWRSLQADTQTISNTVNLPVSLIPANVSIVDTGMTDDVAPTHDLGADDPVTWTVTTTAGAPASAMLALPDPSDCNQLYNQGKGPDGDWHEYDRGCTTYRGKERLKEQPSVDAAMTLGNVSFQYTTAGITSLDPSAYTWQSWDDIKDKTTITGIKATIGSADNSAAMTRINLTLAGMTDEGRANVWAGAPYCDGKELTGTSWPGVIKHLNATIKTRVFKDIDEDGKINAGVSYYDRRSATVDVYKSDEKGTQGVLANRLSQVDSSERSVKLSSGWYLVHAHIDGSKANGETKDKDGTSIYTIGSTDTYYGKSDNTRATTPVSRLVHVNAGDTEYADFGWMADMPRLSVTQTETLGDCKGASCTATVNATLSNDGDRTIPEDTLIHSTLSAGSANDDWSYSTLALDGEHTVNGNMFRDTAGHYWESTKDYTGKLKFYRYTTFDGFDTVEAMATYQGSSAWAVTSDGRVLADRDMLGSTKVGNIGAFDPPEGHKFIHVRPFYSDYNGDGVLAQTDDGALWEYHKDYSGTVWSGKFTKLDVGDAQFDLTKQPKTFGYQLMLVDTQHRLWLMDNKTNTLATKGIFGTYDEHINVPVPFEGGPISIKDIASLPGGNNITYYSGKYKTDIPIAAVVDADGRLWIGHKRSTHDYYSNDWAIVWDKTDVTGVSQLAGVFDFYYSPYYTRTHTVWYLGEDGGLYRFDPDTMMDWRNTEDKKVDTSLMESMSAVPTPGKSVRVLPDKTFSRLMPLPFSGDTLFAAITTNGRLYTWGSNNSSSYGVTIGDHTMRDESSDAPIQTMPATPSNTDGNTTTYKLPFPLAPGDTVTLTRTLTIPRGDADSIATTQTWADGTLTPYKGITGLDKPTPPDTSNLKDFTSGSIAGNDSCLVAGHEYTNHTDYNHEDQCEQHGVTIPALDKGETIITGGISGIAWLDANGDGIRQSNESIKPGVKVRITDKDGKTLQTTETAENGGYSFVGLPQGEYTIWMADSSTKLMWTIQHAGSDTMVDSDINPGLENYGSAAVTLTKEQPNAEHVDGGLTARQTVGELPHSGRIGIVFLIASCLLLMAVGVVRMRFHKPGKHADSSKQVKVVPW